MSRGCHLASPPFGRENFTVCLDAEGFIACLLRFDRHELGAAYVLDDVCVVNLNSRPGSSEEWLTIKGRTVIGNVPLRVRTEFGDLDHRAPIMRLRKVLKLLRTSTEEQCAGPGFFGMRFSLSWLLELTVGMQYTARSAAWCSARSQRAPSRDALFR